MTEFQKRAGSQALGSPNMLPPEKSPGPRMECSLSPAPNLLGVIRLTTLSLDLNFFICNSEILCPTSFSGFKDKMSLRQERSWQVKCCHQACQEDLVLCLSVYCFKQAWFMNIQIHIQDKPWDECFHSRRCFCFTVGKNVLDINFPHWKRNLIRSSICILFSFHCTRYTSMQLQSEYFILSLYISL